MSKKLLAGSKKFAAPSFFLFKRPVIPTHGLHTGFFFPGEEGNYARGQILNGRKELKLSFPVDFAQGKYQGAPPPPPPPLWVYQERNK